MHEKILLVDDEPDFLDVVSEFLREDCGYEVTCANNAEAALQFVGTTQFDLVLSDINMPGIKGYELLHLISLRSPGTKTALITAYEVRDYLRWAKDYNIGNIITKTTPFNFDEMRLLINNIITEDVFGLGKYVDGTVASTGIHRSLEIEPVISQAIDGIPLPAHKRKFRQALGEIVINTVYYGARNEDGSNKSSWKTDVTLLPEETVTLSWATDFEKSGIAIHDQKGRLTKKDVLYWIERNSTKNDQNMSLGLFDEHGKGLFIARETVDRFIINIKHGVSTEVILLNYNEGMYHGHRPLWINEF